MTDIRVLPDGDALASMAANTILELSQKAIQETGRFTIALSGGSTPKTLCELLAAQYSQQIDWNHTFVFWGDERCVPPDDADSNYKMAQDALLDHVPLPASNIYRIKGEIPPEDTASQYQETLHKFFHDQLPNLDLILLGMGDDGHTASLFPGTSAVNEHTRWVVPNYVAAKQTWRITLTLPVVNNAANVMFLVSGSSKAQRLKQVLQGSYEKDQLPSQLIMPIKGNLIWGIDQAASSLL